MSMYTTQLRFICENYAGIEESTGYNNVEQVIAGALPKLFDFDFPIFDEDYRTVIETKIVKHYYTREICEETVGLWKLRLNTTMNEIMPYYNKLYTAWAAEFNPLYDTDITTQHTLDTTREMTNENEQTTTGKSTDRFSDTPQGSLENIENNTYLSSANINDTNATGTANTTENSSSTDEYLEKITGKRGGASYSEMLDKYRDALINIDMMIIDDLADLFFKLW